MPCLSQLMMSTRYQLMQMQQAAAVQQLSPPSPKLATSLTDINQQISSTQSNFYFFKFISFILLIFSSKYKV